MNLVKKVLIVHGDAPARRQLQLLHAGVGVDVRAFPTAAAATAAAHDEWFDLAIVDHALPDAPDSAAVELLRKIQPTIQVIVLVAEIELATVIKGIRLGVADVLLQSDDLRPVVRRVCRLLKLPFTAVDEVTPEELSQAQTWLDKLDGTEEAHSADPFGVHPQEPAAELLRVTKENALLQTQLERLGHERAALEIQLKTVLAQNGDLASLQTELAELRGQREVVTAAQAVIDEKARALADQRAAFARERRVLAEERVHLEATVPAATRDEQQLARERAQLIASRNELAEQAGRLQEDESRLQQERTQLALERRRWHEDLDVLREQEENLRAYEARLREMQARVEADRVGWHSANARPASRSPFTDDAALRDAWAKLQRASELLETERTHFREDKLALTDWDKAIKRREDALAAREGKVAELEQRLRALVPPPAVPAPESTGKSFTRGPFAVAKAVFGSKK